MCPYLQNKKCLIGRPDSETRCMDCMMSRRNMVTGLGDLVALTINTTPAKHLKWKNCNCTKRQDWLNRLWSFVPKKQVRIKPRPNVAQPIKATEQIIRKPT